MAVQTLRSETIDAASEQLGVFLSQQKFDRRDTRRLQLELEDILLEYRSRFGEEAEVVISQERHLDRLRFIVSVKGESCDPYANFDNDDILLALIPTATVLPIWSYSKGYNCITVDVARKFRLSTATWDLLTLIGGTVLGFLGTLLPEAANRFIVGSLMNPVCDAITRLLSGVATLLIFFSVMSGVCGMGSLSNLRRIGGKTFLRFITSLLLCCCIGVALLLPFFPLGGGSSAGFDFDSVFQMLIDIVPGNLVEPFLTGNLLHVIFISIGLSIALLVLGAKAKGLVDMVIQGNALMQTIITPVCRLLPVIIFCTLYQMIVESQFSGLLQLLKYPLLLALCCVAWLLFSILRICLHRHLRPLPLLKKLLSATVIAFSTASSTAAFSTNVENCEKRLGIDRGLIDVAIPLGQTTFMPGTVMLFLCFGFCMAERYQIPTGFSWILTLCIVSILIAIAAPPVPGSAFSCLVLIAAQLGIPFEGVVLAVAFDIIADRIITATSITSLPLELVEIALSLRMIDEETLRR